MEFISVDPPQFKHQQIEAEVRRLAYSLPVGTRLPAERSMAEQYGCNFLTVRRALKGLVEDGTLVRRVGSGTFVARHPSAAARKRTASERLGVLVWKGGDAYAERVVEGLDHEAKPLNVDLRAREVKDFVHDGLSQAKHLEKDGCVAIVLPWFPRDRVDEVRTFVRTCVLPVSLPMVIPGLEVNSFERQEVFASNFSVVEQLGAYFQKLNRGRVAFVGPDAPEDVVLQRFLSSYACWTARAHLPSFCGLVRLGGLTMDALAERWAEYRGDLAVVSYDDEHAMRFMAAMARRGLHAPRDFQILGYNDTPAAATCEPPLSTVSQNFNYIGYWLIKNALALARGEVAQSSSHPRTRLIVRGSCGGAGRIDEALCAELPGLEIIDVEAGGEWDGEED